MRTLNDDTCIFILQFGAQLVAQEIAASEIRVTWDVPDFHVLYACKLFFIPAMGILQSHPSVRPFVTLSPPKHIGRNPTKFGV